MTTRNCVDEEVLRDMLIESQPILWAQSMLEEADKTRSVDARDAILARVGMTLYSRYAVTFDPARLRFADQRWVDSERTACER